MDPDDGPPTRILSIDGGGIRGIIPARVLEEIEARSGRRVHELFDLVAGTSTGALLALGVTVPAPGSQAPRPAGALRDLYREHGPDIFDAPLHHQLGSLFGLTDQRYPDGTLDAVLEATFGDRRLREALTEVLVPTYDLDARRAYFFKRRRARESPGERDHPAREVARAAVAAPTYFEPIQAGGPDGTSDRVLIDGGVVANDPAMCAYAEALAHDDLADEVLLVSLGTGELETPIAYDDARDWGYLGWGARLHEILLDGAQDAVRYHLDHLLGGTDPPAYQRLQPSLDPEDASRTSRPDEALDAASPANIERLEGVAGGLIDENAGTIDAICDRLVPSPA